MTALLTADTVPSTEMSTYVALTPLGYYLQISMIWKWQAQSWRRCITTRKIPRNHHPQQLDDVPDILDHIQGVLKEGYMGSAPHAHSLRVQQPVNYLVMCELFEAVEDYVGKEKFRDLPMRTSSHIGSLRVDGGKACEELLHHGIDLPRYPAGPPSIAYIYCPATTKDLHEDNGFFRIVEGSHRMTRAEIDRTKATPLRLKPDEILIMYADLKIEYPQVGGGVGVWMKVSRSLG
ncbi:hypothetical protein ACJ73_05701 [Blastomyces percursus]|uniref:Uncharacterized protein n=1 Tax=Blastomyces percursus TaxID=1658174 RepID=A0A1J9Q2U1_9EURO|nr:hypothetical protein ACJ73_05701 [Blastomyces percursus]